MNKLISGLSLGIVTLLWAAVSMAAAVSVVPSSTTVDPGAAFTLTVNATAFPGDGATTGVTGGSFTFTFNGTDFAILGASLPTSPTPNTPGNPFDFITPLTIIDANTVGLSVLRNGTTGFNYATGDFTAFTLQLQALPGATPGAAANIVMVDDGLDNSWTLQDATALEPVDYTQASVSVMNAVGAPNIVVTDSVLPNNDQLVDFGNVDLSVDATETVTVTNSGDGNLTIGTLTSPTGDFSLSNDNCSGQVVPAAGTCTVTVHFIPTANGPASSSFDIPSDDPDTLNVTVILRGVGGLPVIVVTDTDAAAPIDPNDHQVVFGDVQVNTPSGPGPSVTVTNNGPGTLHVGTITPPADPHFTFQNDACSEAALVGVGATCSITVQFTPTATGVLTSSFDIPSDDPNTPVPVTESLTGNGIPTAAADIAVTDSVPPADDHAIPFGSVIVGDSPSNVVTVTNNGVADLVVSGATGLTAPFSLGTDNCTGQPVAQNTTCTIDVVYSPTAVGATSQTLTIASNDPDTPTVDVAVSGTGLPVPTPDITMSTTTIAFGNVLAGSTATPVTVTVTNSGGANLDIGQIAGANALLAPYGIANDLCSNQSIGAGLTCTFDVTFAPTAPGTVNEAFDIPSNDTDENPVIVNVSGTGTVPDINVSDSDSLPMDLTVAFGNVAVDGTSSPIVVTVTNTGLATLDIGQIDVTNLPATFAISNDNCSNQSVAAAGTCTFKMTFSPTEIGTVTGSFDIPSNDPDANENPVIVTVNGNGTGASSGLTGGSALDPGTLLGLGLLGFAVKRRRA